MMGDMAVEGECRRRAGAKTVQVLTGYRTEQACDPDRFAGDRHRAQGHGLMGRGSIAALLCLLAGALPIGAQSILPGGIVNAASYAAGAPLAPGSIAAAFGSFLLSAPAAASGATLPSNLGRLSILVDGQAAPLFYASGSEVNFQVPWELAGDTQATVTVMVNAQTGAGQTLLLAPFSPAIFSLNSQGTGQGAILDLSYKVVDASEPAIAGSSIVQIYATGLGPVSNQPPDGYPAPAGPFSLTSATPVVTIGGATAQVLYSGLAPTLVGVYQINALVPAGAATGVAVPVSISIGTVASNTVTMAVDPSPANPVPAITSLSPSPVLEGPPATLTVDGTGFVPSSVVTVNGIAAPTTFVSATELDATLSAAAVSVAGSFPVTVINPAPAGGTSNTASFIVLTGSVSGGAGSIAWNSFGRDPQHTALSLTAAQPLHRIRWSAPVDRQPQYTGNELLIHYGSPLVTAQNTVIVPVKTGAISGFEVDALNAATGSAVWTIASDYVLPPHDWVPEFGPALTPASRVYFPGAGGTVYYRDSPDSPSGRQGQITFYGMASYLANQQTYNANVMVSTPIVSDAAGDIFFGFTVTGSTALSLRSGIARIDASGQGSWAAAATAAGDSAIVEVPLNCAPALSADQSTVYIAVSSGVSGYLLALDSTTLQRKAEVRLFDPVSGNDATLSDDGTASPTVGPDGDVFYGVLENPEGENHYRGWLLHFDSLLSQTRIPGAFGWDDTASVVPSFLAPGYTGASPYLLMTKYNDYAGAGGTGENRIAILDPGGTENYALTGTQTMKEVMTTLGPTPAGSVPGVREWCIDTAAVDPVTGSVFAGSEDGKLYRWDLGSNSLSQSIVLSTGLGEAYTPTLVGPDGTVYAINNATLFAIGQ
jgi:uncharacterized protein (TIGR03437 family)